MQLTSYCNTRILRITIIIVALSFYSFPAHAYIDPGTGSMIVQLLLGGFAGVIVILKLYWTRIKGILKKIAPGRAASVDEKSRDQVQQ